jgi:hypothetical protein
MDANQRRRLPGEFAHAQNDGLLAAAGVYAVEAEDSKIAESGRKLGLRHLVHAECGFSLIHGKRGFGAAEPLLT